MLPVGGARCAAAGDNRGSWQAISGVLAVLGTIAEVAAYISSVGGSEDALSGLMAEHGVLGRISGLSPTLRPLRRSNLVCFFL